MINTCAYQPLQKLSMFFPISLTCVFIFMLKHAWIHTRLKYLQLYTCPDKADRHVWREVSYSHLHY